MLVCILNTLRRRIWDISFFLFSDYLNPQLARMEFSRKLWLSMELNSKGLTFNRKCIPSGDFHSKFKSSSRKFLRQSPLFSDKNIDSIWCQRTEKQNFYIESNVMSEQIKMPSRHFLCRDYLHIGFYIKVLLFVYLALQIYIYCFYLFYCFFFEILFLYFINIRKFFDGRNAKTT